MISYWLLLLLIFTSLLEAFGIGLIGPFIRIASAPDTLHDIGFLRSLYLASGASTELHFIPILGMFVAIFFLIKSVAYFLARSYILYFSYHQKELLVLRLLKAYLAVPYTFHLRRNTASLIKNIIIEVNQFTQNSLLQVLPLLIFFKVFGKRFRKWGKTRSQANQEMIRILNHGLGSIKETKLIGCEPYFDEQMKKQGILFSRSATLFASSQLLPRILIESLLVILIIGYVCFYQIFSLQSVEELAAV